MHTPAIVLAAVAALTAAAWAQPGCEPLWDRTLGTNGPANGSVNAFQPAGTPLYVAGSFTNVAGLSGTAFLAQFDRALHTWSSVGGGLHAGSDGFAGSIAFVRDGIAIAGRFSDAGGVAGTTNIAIWDGAAFHRVATGWAPGGPETVWCLDSLLGWPTERLYIGGQFQQVDGQVAANIAMWNGTTTMPLATAMTGQAPRVMSLAFYFGDPGESPVPLHIGGRFASVDGVAAPLVARRRGAAWVRLGDNLTAATPDAEVLCMEVRFSLGRDAGLYAGGRGLLVNGAPCSVAQWDGTTWRGGQALAGPVTSLRWFNDGYSDQLYAGTTMPAQSLVRLDGNVWMPVPGAPNGPIATLGNKYTKDMLVGGSFTAVDSASARAAAARTACTPCPTADIDGDGDVGTDQDIEAFFRCLAGACPDWCDFGCYIADFNCDGDVGTDEDIESFFRVLAGHRC